MTVWIAWSSEVDVLFRKVYEEMTGELVQQDPPKLEGTDMFLIGSSVCTEKTAQALIELGAENQIMYFLIDPSLELNEPQPPQEI